MDKGTVSVFDLEPMRISVLGGISKNRRMADGRGLLQGWEIHGSSMDKK